MWAVRDWGARMGTRTSAGSLFSSIYMIYEFDADRLSPEQAVLRANGQPSLFSVAKEADHVLANHHFSSRSFRLGYSRNIRPCCHLKNSQW